MLAKWKRRLDASHCSHQPSSADGRCSHHQSRANVEQSSLIASEVAGAALMRLPNLAVIVPLVILLSIILFQCIYMLISPRRWVRSKWALKSSQISEQSVSRRWMRIQLRIAGFLGIVFVALFVSLLVGRP